MFWHTKKFTKPLLLRKEITILGINVFTGKKHHQNKHCGKGKTKLSFHFDSLWIISIPYCVKWIAIDGHEVWEGIVGLLHSGKKFELQFWKSSLMSWIWDILFSYEKCERPLWCLNILVRLLFPTMPSTPCVSGRDRHLYIRHTNMSPVYLAVKRPPLQFQLIYWMKNKIPTWDLLKLHSKCRIFLTSEEPIKFSLESSLEQPWYAEVVYVKDLLVTNMIQSKLNFQDRR